MPRYALKIEYDGRPFVGWQWQESHPSVQAAMEAAVARIAPEGPPVIGAGRTDAGVHATGQVAHVDLARAWEPSHLSAALNAHLRPDPVAVVAAAQVPDRFHARFAAVEREYLFRLVARRAPLVHDRGKAWRVGHRLDLAAMREGAAAMIGLHDFTTFRSSMCQAKSPLRTLDALEIEEIAGSAGHEYRFRLRARSFLHNQVRGIVGTLERVGSGAWPATRVAEALAARSRAACGPVCPPDGLYLVAVRYAPDPFA
jgi:tRNA pseudouridine38-40 synthase